MTFKRLDDQVGYWFYIDTGTSGFKYSKTTDGGATWGAGVLISPAVAGIAYDIWADWWTPGDTGTLIHTWAFEATASDVIYRTLDTATDTLGTARVVFDGATAVAGRGAFVSGTKTRSGYLYCAYDIDAGAERGLHRSTDGGPTWSANLSSTFVEATQDECLLFPASNTGDDNDCWCIYLDADVNAITLKMWDSSAVAQTESATIVTHTDDTTDLNGQYGYSASVRHSDGHLFLVTCLIYDDSTNDIQTFDLNGTGSITAKTNITTNIDDCYYPAVFIHQSTDDIYVAYNGLRAGSQVSTPPTSSKVYYVKSTDDGTTWSAGDTAYMEGAVAAVAQVWAPLMGLRFYVGWRVGTALSGNAVNSIAFSAPGTPGSWTMNDSSPVSVAQTFAAPADPWTLIYWGPGVLAFETPVVAGAAFVAVPTGELTISGPVPTVLLTALVRITPETGALHINVPYRADTGLLTADSSLVTADTGAAKGGPTVLVQYIVQPGIGELTVTGFAPTIGLPKTIVTGLGQATLTGFAPKIAKTIVPALGQLTLSGFAPKIPTSVVTGFGQAIVTGFAPSVSFFAGSANVTPGVGALTATGFSPTAAKTIVPASGQLTLQGFAPTLPLTVVPGFGELAVTGYAPTVTVAPLGIFITPGTGELTATGYELMVGSLEMEIDGGPVLVGSLSGGRTFSGSLDGGPVLEGELVGGPV